MDSFLEMNIFFFIASVFSVIFGVLITIGLLKVLRILKNMEEIGKNVSEETKALKGDVEVVRQKVRSGGLKVSHVLGVFSSVIKRLIKLK